MDQEIAADAEPRAARRKPELAESRHPLLFTISGSLS